MPVIVKHPFTSAKTDGVDGTLIQPSNWNAEHTLHLTGPALLGKSAAGDGAVVEITLGANLSFSGNTLVAASLGGSAGSSVGSAIPEPLGVASAGVSSLASREDHVHVLPTITPADIGAATSAQGTLATTAVQPAGLTKTAVGLSNVDNTSDANKPVSSATVTALAAKAATGHSHVFADVTGLVTGLAAKADTGHTHTSSAITDLATALSSVGVVPDTMLAPAATSVVGTEYVGLVVAGVLYKATVNQLASLFGTMVALRNVDGSFAGMAMPGGGATNDMIVIGSSVPLNTDGRPDGTIYIQVG